MEYYRFMRPSSNLLMPPIPPDILVCNPAYGNALNFNACMFAIRQMPRTSRSTTAVYYKDSRPNSPNSYELPIQYSDPRGPGVGFFFKKINDPSSKCPGRIVPGLSDFGLGLCTATIDLGPSPCSYALSDGSPPRSFLLVGHSVTSAMSKYWRIHNRRSTRLYYPIASLVLPCP